MARFAAETLNLKKVAVLRDRSAPYSRLIASSFQERFKELGGQTVLLDYRAGQANFSAVLTPTSLAGAGALFMPGFAKDVGEAARQARAAGVTLPFLGSDGWSTPTLFESAGSSLTGSYFVDHVALDDTAPEMRAFLKSFHSTFPEAVATTVTVVHYDAMMMVAEALRHAPNLTAKEVRDALGRLRGLSAVSGPITMGKNGNPTKPAAILRVDADERFTFVRRALP
jgi:branched-chain amino acid transport system substrate-binding protein